MNKLLIGLMLLGSLNVNAECCPSQCDVKPKIKYITKTKVVEKIVEKPVPFVVEKQVVQVVEQRIPIHITNTVYKKIQKKNRLSVLGGTGPTRINMTQTEVRLERGAVFGVQYQRMLSDSLSIGIQGQSNETVLGSIGLEF